MMSPFSAQCCSWHLLPLLGGIPKKQDLISIPLCCICLLFGKRELHKMAAAPEACQHYKPCMMTTKWPHSHPSKETTTAKGASAYMESASLSPACNAVACCRWQFSRQNSVVGIKYENVVFQKKSSLIEHR